MSIDVREHIGARIGDTEIPKLIETVKDRTLLPKKIEVLYYDIDLDGALATVSSEIVAKGSNSLQFRLPIFAKRSEAKAMADRLMRKSWTESVTYEFSLPLDFVKYDPGDVLELQVDDTTTINVRVIEANIDPRGVVQFSAVRHDASIYTDNTPISDSTPPPVSTIEYDTVKFHLVETPPLYFNTEPANFYIAPIQTPNLRTGTVYVSSDGTEYEPVGEISGGTFVGSTVNSVPSGSAAIRDLTNKIVLSPLEGCTAALTSRSLAAITNNANMLYINGEIIKFTDAVQLNNGNWEVSGLIRGCKGTEDKAQFAIPSGSTAILLDGCLPVYGLPRATGQYWIKIPVEEAGETVVSVTSKSITLAGEAFKGWRPVRIRYDVVDSDHSDIYFAYRNRTSPDWNGDAEIPPDEDLYKFVAGTDSETVSVDAGLPIRVSFGAFDPLHVDLYESTRKLAQGKINAFNVFKNRNERIPD